MRGTVSVGFSRLNSHRLGQSPFIFVYRNKGQQTLLDYQVFVNLESDFIYRVDEDVEGFGLDRIAWNRVSPVDKY